MEKENISHQNINLRVHINDVLNVIDHEDLSDIILVGHSYGGMVISGVADQAPYKIKTLIYVDALVPQNGESMLSMIDSRISSFLKNQAKENDDWEAPPPENYNFPNNEDIKWITKQSTPHPLKCFDQPISLRNNLENFRVLYIKCNQDHSLDSMLIRAKEMNLICHLLYAGHFPMITDS